jgi:hypothetical protein
MGVLAEDGTGKLSCEIRENGQTASGVISVQREGKEVAATTCGKELSLKAGSYTATLRLDGALDGPEQSQPLTIRRDATALVKAEFATGTLEVRIVSQGRRAAGLAMIRRAGKEIGALGSGVTAHLSAGSYEVVARYRGQEKVFADVKISGGGHVSLDAAFD